MGSVPEPWKFTVPPCATVTLAAGALMVAAGGWFAAPVTVTERVGGVPVASMPTELRTCRVEVMAPATVIGTETLCPVAFGMPPVNSQVWVSGKPSGLVALPAV